MQKKHKIIEAIKRAAVGIFIAACLFCLFLPLPQKFSDDEIYECVWADGSVTMENYSSAYQSLTGIDGESVLLERNGLTGKIKSGATKTYRALSGGNLNELLSCSAQGTRIDIAALYRTFSDRAWYDGEYYVWTGDKIERTGRTYCSELVLMQGNVSARALKESSASTVYLCAAASIKADTFVGSNVKTVHTEDPYLQNGGAIYLNTAGGKRLLAAIGGIKELTLDSDLKFADEGALLACDSLVSLSLPFVGNTVLFHASSYKGEFAHLFSTGKEYRVPATLARVEVTGGKIDSFAFYACSDLKEIDACKVSASDISKTAFLGLPSLELLHSPRSDVTLSGNFSSSAAPCGCTVFQRK